MLKMAACPNSLDEKSKLEEEFQTWNGLTKDPTETIIMIDSTEDKSGCVCLNLLLAGQHEFQLFCPKGYPGYNALSRFIVDAGQDKSNWEKSLNQFLKDCKRKLFLTDVLDKALSLHKITPCRLTKLEQRDWIGEATDSKDWIGDATEMEQRDWIEEATEIDDDEDEMNPTDDQDLTMLDDDSYFTTDWELQVTKLRKNWAMKEIEIREAMKKQVSSLNASPSHSLNVSLPSSSRSTPHSSPSAGIQFLFGLLTPLPIGIRCDHGPRDSMMQRVSNLDILKLSYWNPTKDMKTVLTEIREYLEKWARVDVESPRNDPKVYCQGSYTDIEHDLLKLALETQTKAKKADDEKSLEESLRERETLVKLLQSEISRQANEINYLRSRHQGSRRGKSFCSSDRPGERGNEYWQKGIGYGHNNRPGWDIQAFIAAQKEKDKQIVAVLNEIVVQLRNICSIQLLSESSEGQDKTQTVSLTDLYAIIEGSALLTFMEASLKDVSFLEICRHTSLYKVILDIIKEIALRPKLVGLLSNLPNQDRSISQHLSVLESSASGVLQHVDKIGNGSIPKDTDVKRMKVEEGSKPSLLMMAISCGMIDSEEMKEKTEEELLMENYNTTVAGETLARQFLCVSHLVRTKLEDLSNSTRHETQNTVNKEDVKASKEDVLCNANSSLCNGQICSEPADVSVSSDEDSMNENLEELYFQHLKHLQFMPFTFTQTGIGRNLYMGQLNKHTKPLPSQIFRIAQELSTLSTSLPFSLSSTIFVRTDEEKVNLMRALITGPEGTPYSGGCFLFDIYFPPSYPKGPPMVSILVKVRMNCMKWAMINYLDFPPPGFEEVITRHFYLKKDRILKEVEQWMKEDSNSKFKKCCEKFKTDFKMKVKIPPEMQLKEKKVEGETNKEHNCKHNSTHDT
ncbi:uncharacterized protein LOC117104721 [Anneissia japonica]|uniref:uncharacterized protein LOC117104721 n=1 Tax=Anneissia japonica TaxID=1529436 RepID=UPI001425AEAF|nr:uncharacterized protein LOC117104721 [Anneissia japonica]